MSSYTSSLGLELITPGSQAGLWGNTTNNTFTLVDQAITGVTPISFASASGSTYTLTDYNGAADEARSAVLNITGTAIGANTVVVPNKQKTYLVRNNTGQDVVFQTAVPTATYSVGAGYSILIFCDGNNNVFTGIASPSVGTLSVAGGGTGTTTFLTGGFIKSAGGTSALTASQYVALGSEVSGTLPVGSGGTGVTSITANGLVVGAGASAVTTLVGTSAGNVPTWNGTAWIPVTPTGGVTSVTAGTNISITGTSTSPIVNVSGQIGVANGGTGVSTFAAGFVKSPGLASNLTTVTSIDLSTSDVSGTLTVGRGGTGAASLTSSALLVGNGTGSVTTISPGANGTVLTSNGSTWSAASLPSFVTAVSAGTGITVTGTTNPTITNAGVTSLTAGTGITITGGSTGALQISASGTSGVASVSATIPLSITGTASNPVINLVNVGVVYGGTGAASFTSGALLKGNGTSALSSASAADIVAAIGTAAVTNATNASTAAACSGNAATVSNGVYTTGTQTIGGVKTFTGGIFTNAITSPAFNYQSTVSTYYASGNIVLSINSTDTVFYSTGDFKIPGSNATKATGTTWINPSDQRLKDNVQDFTPGLSAAMQIQPKSWVFNGKGGTTQGTKGVGVIADEIQNVLPETVTTYKAKLNPTDAEDTDIKQFDANDITWVLVNAVKELKAELDAAKARIAELEAK